MTSEPYPDPPLSEEEEKEYTCADCGGWLETHREEVCEDCLESYEQEHGLE